MMIAAASVDRACEHGVPSETPGNDKPVEIGADGQSESRPERFRRAAEKGQARHTHEEPARHVAGLRGHGRDEGAQGSASQEEGVSAPSRPAAEQDPHPHDQGHIDQYGPQHDPFDMFHFGLPFA